MVTRFKEEINTAKPLATVQKQTTQKKERKKEINSILFDLF